MRHMGLVQCRDNPCRFYLKEDRANECILGCPVWPLLVRFRLLIVFAGHNVSLTANALSSTIKPIQVVLPHQRDQLVGVIRGGGVPGLVDLASERVRIGLDCSCARLPPVAEEKPDMCGDTLLETVVLGEVGVDRDPLAVEKFPGRCPGGSRRPPAFNAKQILGLPDCVFVPPISRMA